MKFLVRKDKVRKARSLTLAERVAITSELDGERSILKKIIAYAARLRAQEEVKRFEEEVKSVKKLVQDSFSKEGNRSIDLWDKIRIRLAEEDERAYLREVKTHSFRDSLPFVFRTVSLTSIAGCVFVFTIVLFQTEMPFQGYLNNDVQVALNPVNNDLATLPYQPASHNSESGKGFSFSSDPGIRVDWIRGAGPLRILEDSNNKVAVMWIQGKKRTVPSEVEGEFLAGNIIQAANNSPRLNRRYGWNLEAPFDFNSKENENLMHARNLEFGLGDLSKDFTFSSKGEESGVETSNSNSKIPQAISVGY